MSRRKHASRGLAALSFTLFVATAAAALMSTPAVAATSDGSDWGPDGSLSSDSATTVRWDNTGNGPANTVPRDETQKLVHTAGMTYADLDADDRAAFQESFGNLQVTVSQAANLTLQNVTVTASGAVGGNGNASGRRLEVFQCWGDAASAQPEPENCQYAAKTAGPSANKAFAPEDAPYVVGGNWEYLAWQTNTDGELVPVSSPGDIPFRAIDGTVVPSRSADNPYFSEVTSNELIDFSLDEQGGGSRPFEIQTTSEAQGLGCGVTADVVSTSRCWLVIIPKGGSTERIANMSQKSGLSPTLWANRLQIELGMADAGTVCGSGDSRTLLVGSELLAPAMSSWIPELCGTDQLALGYTVLGDAQVRRELDQGRRQHAMLSLPPKADSIAVPVALAATVFAYRYDHTSNKTPIPEIKLNPRLVAKLLTQSYQGGVDSGFQTQIFIKAPWISTLPGGLADDPEFLALNPENGNQLSGLVGDLIASLTDSDASRQVWTWILADPGARSFLSGCPDDAGNVVNPFFSARKYVGCENRAEELDAITQSRIASTRSPANYQYATPVYPSDGAIFPQPGWYERDAVLIPDEQLPLTLGDLHSRLPSLVDSGRAVGRALYPQNLTWCSSIQDVSCTPAPGRWKNSSPPQNYGDRGLMGITDSVTAARLRLQTALLCGSDDTTGENCVGASMDTLGAEAARFEPDAQGILVPTDDPDYAGGAYPLTLPVYAAVATAGLETAEAQSLAAIFAHFVNDGQTPGFGIGDLPPGYAPLTDDLLASAADALKELTAWVPPVVEQPTKPAAVKPPTAFVPQSKPQPKPASSVPAPVASPDPQPVAEVSATPPAEIGFPQFGLAGGLLAAIVTGAASPIVGGNRRRR